MKVKKFQELIRKHGVDAAVNDYSQRLGIVTKGGCERSIENNSIDAQEISLIRLAEASLGADATMAMFYGSPIQEVAQIAESAGLSYTAFPKLAGQAIQQKIIQSYNSESFVLRGLVNAEPQSFSGKGTAIDIDSLSEAEEVGENQDYPWSYFGENTIGIPQSKKWGNIIGMSRECFVGDRTGEIMRKAAAVGKSIAIAVEKEIARVILGIDDTFERNGTPIPLYGADNEVTNFVLNGWRDFDALDQKFNEMTDPVSGEPLEMPVRDVLTSFVTANREAKHLINSTAVSVGTDNTTTPVDTSINGNPISDLGSVNHSTRLYHLAQLASPDGLGLTAPQAKSLVIYGDLRSAFVRKVIWPLETEEIRDVQWSFEKDIIAAWKASERSRTAVERRHVVLRAYNSAAA